MNALYVYSALFVWKDLIRHFVTNCCCKCKKLETLSLSSGIFCPPQLAAGHTGTERNRAAAGKFPETEAAGGEPRAALRAEPRGDSRSDRHRGRRLGSNKGEWKVGVSPVFVSKLNRSQDRKEMDSCCICGSQECVVLNFRESVQQNRRTVVFVRSICFEK